MGQHELMKTTLKMAYATLTILKEEIEGSHLCHLEPDIDTEGQPIEPECWACEVSALSDIEHTLMEIEGVLVE